MKAPEISFPKSINNSITTMKIWQKFLGSSTILAGLIFLMASSVFRLYQAEIVAQTTQKKTAAALNIAYNLENSLKDQALNLKDFVVFNHQTTHMVKFQRLRSNFLIQLDQLEILMDQAPELSVVRRRHAFLTKLANSIDNNSDLVTSLHDLQAINSYIEDITFYLADVSQKAQQQNNTANNRLERIRIINTKILIIGIISIFLVFLSQLILIIIPVLCSLHQLQLGVAKIRNGNLSYHLDIKTNDEIEHLANEFNQMTAKLSDFYDFLEAKVSERTANLFKINQELKTEISDRIQAEFNLQQSQIQLTQKAQELEAALQELKATQTQLIQNEKMSSLGQLVAGVAHEINNPVNFIHGNITPLKEYVQNFMHLIKLYQLYYPQSTDEIVDYMEYIDLPFILEDSNKIIASLEVGTRRIKEIVLSLRNFSRLDESDMKEVNIHEGIDNTLLILQHRLKAKPHQWDIEVIKDYGDLPLIECYPGQLNQVFMNIISNAIDALEGNHFPNSLSVFNNFDKRIEIKTKQLTNNFIAIHIKDNGGGITEENRQRIFDPFFTTKPIGKGTGLGLSISYQVVTSQHKGNLQCITKPGEGTEFIILLPIKQNHVDGG